MSQHSTKRCKATGTDTDHCAVSVQRKVLKDFELSDGNCVPAGNVICVPQQAVMRDPKLDDRLDEFLPFRFVDLDSGAQNAIAVRKFSDLKPPFYLWDAMAKTWYISIVAYNPLHDVSDMSHSPGRWYVMKQFFVHLLTKYNFKLVNPKAKMTLTYITIVFPRPRLELLLEKR